MTSLLEYVQDTPHNARTTMAVIAKQDLPSLSLLSSIDSSVINAVCRVNHRTLAKEIALLWSELFVIFQLLYTPLLAARHSLYSQVSSR